MSLTIRCYESKVGFHTIIISCHQMPRLWRDDPPLKFHDRRTSRYVDQDSPVIANSFVELKLCQCHDGQIWCVVDSVDGLAVTINKGMWLQVSPVLVGCLLETQAEEFSREVTGENMIVHIYK
jgi:hypothetical protein